MKTLSLGLTVSLLLSGGPAFAADEPTRAANRPETPVAVVMRPDLPVTPLDTSTLKSSVARTAQAQGGPSADRAEWSRRLEDAQTRRKRGLRLVMYGAGIGVVGTIVAVSVIGSSDSYGGVRSGSAIGTITTLGGGALATYGAFKWVGANSDIDEIDREGRQKGYLAIVPTRDGVVARASIGF